MKDFFGSQIKSDFASFMSKETNQPLEFWYTKLSEREIKPWKPSSDPFPVIKLEPIQHFDYRDLVKESKFNPEVRPSNSDVVKFMVQECGHTYESAFIKLNSPKINIGSNGASVIRGF